MAKFKNNLILAIFLFGILPASADAPKDCREGRVVFGKLICSSSSDPAPLMEAYFFGATSAREIRDGYPERVDKIRQRCRDKLDANQSISYRVEPVEACAGKRGYQQPCVQDSDCLEGICHRDRGTCSTVFIVPAFGAP